MLLAMSLISGCKTLFLKYHISPLQVSFKFTCSSLNNNPQNLPKQPVPKLADTLAKYLLSVRPFLNNVEFERTTSLVKDFEARCGQKLQTLLEERAVQSVNWLSEWWLNAAYLEYRVSLVANSSPGLLLPHKIFHTQYDQLQYAAKILLGALKYKRLIDNDEIPIDKMGKHPLDMAQYKKIFGTCRIPCPKRDRLSFNSSSRHIVVIHNNHFFRVDVYSGNNKMLDEDQITDLLKEVVSLSVIPNNEGVGILTSEHRDVWAYNFQILLKDKINRESIAELERSIMVLCLDSPVNLCCNDDIRRTVGGAQTIHGCGSRWNGCNRWYDKTIQLIVGLDGTNGLTYEHSPAEGQPVANLADFLIKYVDDNNDDDSKSKTPSPRPPKHLKFHVTPEISGMVINAKTNLDKLVCDLDMNCFQYNKYGKSFIKSQKLSPDSYLQMAMQFAYYRLHKEPGAHYESAATRMFVGGRTETIRSCSVESVKFAKTMLNKGASSKDKVTALKNAITSHKKYAIQAIRGLGVDRHLLGLKLIAIENSLDLHDLYSDISYIRSGHWTISSSQVALKCDGFMCYGPVVPDGYALCYNPRDDYVNFAAAAYVSHPETSSNCFRNALEESLQNMHDVLISKC